MQNNKKYIFLIIFYQNSIWYTIFIGIWITAVFQAALHNLETYWVSSLPCMPFSVGLVCSLNVYTLRLTIWIM